MPPYTCGICLKSYMYNDSLKRHMRTKHSTDEREEKLIKRSKKMMDFVMLYAIFVDRLLEVKNI